MVPLTQKANSRMKSQPSTAMEGIFNSKDLYEYLEEQKQHISKTRELSLYYKATSKSIEDDEYSLKIWLDYIRLLMNGTNDMTEEARETFRMIKMRFCKFYNYWEAYIGFEISSKYENLGKVLQQSIEFVKVKEFKEKRSVLEYLECVMSYVSNGEDPSVFCHGNMGRYCSPNTLQSPAVKSECNSMDNAEPYARVSENVDNIVATPSSLRCAVESDRHDVANELMLDEQKGGRNSTDRLYFTGTDGNAWSRERPPCNKVLLKGIPIQLERESYANGITAEINAVLRGEAENSSPQRGLVQRERTSIRDKEVEVLKQIGKGGSSKVYKVLLGTEIYALKKVELVGDEKMLDSYMNEINLLYKFKGAPEIVSIIDHEMGTDYLCILLEYGETDLAKIIRSGNLSINFIKDVWEQILSIVKRVHEERIIHCDLKPANFLFVKGRIKLIDFGISKVIRNDTTSILSEEQCGTVNYMSPEAVTQNKSKLARSSDIWSLGCILYEMVHSRPPLHKYPNLIQKIQRLQEYSGFEYESKHELAVAVMKECLVRDPKKRPSIDRLLNHRFLRGEIERECLESFLERVIKDPPASVKDVVDQFYKP